MQEPRKPVLFNASDTVLRFLLTDCVEFCAQTLDVVAYVAFMSADTFINCARHIRVA